VILLVFDWEMIMTQEDIESHLKFLFTLEWLLAITHRYAECFQFCLAHINFENPRILGEIYGAQKASHKLDEVSRSLRKAFVRKTDLVTRDGSDFWILVPYAPDDEKLIDKIRYIIETTSQGGLHIVERDLSVFALPNEASKLSAGLTALEFLSHLKQNHVALARQELSLPPCD